MGGGYFPGLISDCPTDRPPETGQVQVISYANIVSLFLLLTLGHRTSVKRFISLEFLNLRESAGLLGRGLARRKAATIHRTTQTQNKRRQTSMP
jgi:hypothetical protein